MWFFQRRVQTIRLNQAATLRILYREANTEVTAGRWLQKGVNLIDSPC